MAPKIIREDFSSGTGMVTEITSDEHESKQLEVSAKPRKLKLLYKYVIWYIVLHSAAFYGLWLSLTSAQWKTNIFAAFLYTASGFGLSAGVHRLWSHRSYKATWQLRLILMILNTMAFQGTIFYWARDHRTHHKHSDTDADPHNVRRGLFFSHLGWLMHRRLPDVKAAGLRLDFSDLKADPIVMFQEKYYWIMMPMLCFVIPTIIPNYFWGESIKHAFFIAANLRYTLVVHAVLLINSVAHRWGSKPYDTTIKPSNNMAVSMMILGEGWHNFHHVFPWDYKGAELGNFHFNFTTAFIEFFARVGWAYDLKTVSTENVQKRKQRTGEDNHGHIWGWGDKDQNQEEQNDAHVVGKAE